MSKLPSPKQSHFVWPKPEDQSDKTLIANVHKYGCHLVGILAEEHCPSYVFSVGLFANYGQPEILIFGPGGNKGPNVINEICRHAARGERYFAGDRTDKLIKGYDACFVSVPQRVYPQYLGYALWFYRSLAEPFPCVQLVWPDRRGKYPWDANCEVGCRAIQPVLKNVA